MYLFTKEGVVKTSTPKFGFVAILSLFFSTFLLASAASAAELVVNGGFESPVVPTIGDTDAGWMTYYGENGPPVPTGDCHPDDAADRCNDVDRVPGWSVFWTDDIINHEQLNPGRLELQTGNIAGWPAYDGSDQKAELDSHHRLDHPNTNVTIAQLLPTCPLTAYTLSYGWKSRTDLAGDNDVRVIVGEEKVATHEANDDWEMEEIPFVSDNSYETLLLFGSIGDETTEGMFLDEVSVIGPDGSDSEPCTLVCDDKPMELTLRYNGNDSSNHQQSGNEVIIFPEDVVGTFPATAIIEVYGHKRKSPELLETSQVNIDGFFSVSGPHKRIPPRLTFKIYHPDDLDNPVQTVTFHTSCSQPMDAGDEFGAITVWSAIN